jgi:hypothetical protein
MSLYHFRIFKSGQRQRRLTVVILGIRINAVSNAHQQSESEVRKRYSYLGDHRSLRVVAWCM